MSILASVGKRESHRIGEAARSTMDDLGHQCERLQGPRAEPLNQQQGSKIAKLLFVSNRQHGAEAAEAADDDVSFELIDLRVHAL